MANVSNRNYMLGSKVFLRGINNQMLYTFVHTPDNASVIEVNQIPNPQRNDGFNAIAKVNIDRTIGYVPGLGLNKLANPATYVKEVYLKRITGDELAASKEVGRRLIVDLGGVQPSKVADILPALNAKYNLGISIQDIYNDDITSGVFSIRFSKVSLAFSGYLPISFK